jgi:hypothetical protein
VNLESVKRGVCTIGSRVKGSAFGYPVNCCCAVGRLKSPVSYVYAFVRWVVKGDPVIAVIASRGVLVESVDYNSRGRKVYTRYPDCCQEY